MMGNIVSCCLTIFYSGLLILLFRSRKAYSNTFYSQYASLHYAFHLWEYICIHVYLYLYLSFVLHECCLRAERTYGICLKGLAHFTWQNGFILPGWMKWVTGVGCMCWMMFHCSCSVNMRSLQTEVFRNLKFSKILKQVLVYQWATLKARILVFCVYKKKKWNENLFTKKTNEMNIFPLVLNISILSLPFQGVKFWLLCLLCRSTFRSIQ